MSPDDPRHGTLAGYQRHRRLNSPTCAPCRAARVRYEKRRKYDAQANGGRLVEPIGTRRRVRALVALGWTYRRIGDQLGITAGGVYRIATDYSPTIRRDVADRVAVVFERMSMTLPPAETRWEKRDQSYARTVARKHGWAPPLAWDDIDDPGAVPDLGEADIQLKSGARPTVYVLEDAEFLADDGRNLTYVLERLGVKRETFHSACRREGRLDLYWRLANREPNADNLRAARDGLARAKREVA